MPKRELVDVSINVKRETANAYGCDAGGDGLCWLPKSMCELSDDRKTITMPVWLAKEKDLI